MSKLKLKIILPKIKRFNSKLLAAKTLLILFLFSSCKKLVEIPLPADQLTENFVFANDNSAIQALNGIYSKMMEDPQQFSSGFTTLFTGLSSNEINYYSPSFRDEFILNQITKVNHANLQTFFWNPAYRFIYASNKCIEGVSKSKGIDLNAKNMIVGEAKFIRAFSYFYLINLFGDVPLILSTGYQENQTLARTPKAKVYSQIIEDLNEAMKYLSTDYVSQERLRPNRLAAEALLARTYLFNHDWINAEKLANSVITSDQYHLSENLNEVFLSNSKETIWQLFPVTPSINTWEGYNILPAFEGLTPTYFYQII